ncbi:MAG: HAD family phosphatase [Acetatifactor sp.]|nr:HAD family phosphatase [Acetatifactor sp.]
MIRNIIFDIGNVLTDFRWEGFLLDKGLSHDIVDRIGNATVRSKEWSEVDRGVWSLEELLEAFIRNDPSLEKEMRFAFDDFTGMVTPREYAIPWVQELKKKGFDVYYLSNFSEKAKKECSDALNFLPYMDGGILSYKEKMVKPDPAIYKLLMERYGLKAQESVFLDDTLANVEAARLVGMHGIHFKSKEQATEELEKMYS